MRKIMLSVAAITLAAGAAGCSSHKAQEHKTDGVAANGQEAGKETPKPAPQNQQAPRTQAEVKAYADEIGKAMNDIPPELRVDFQKYLVCDLKHDHSLLNGDRIRAMTARLKADRNLAHCQ